MPINLHRWTISGLIGAWVWIFAGCAAGGGGGDGAGVTNGQSSVDQDDEDGAEGVGGIDDGSTDGGPTNGTATPVGRVGLELVADGLTSPTGLTDAGDGSGRLFVSDQVGQVRIIDGQGNLLAAPFLDVSDRMVTLNPNFDERGALGIAFHPDYVTNGRFFLYYSAPADDASPEGFDSQSRVSEFLVSESDANLADPNSERVILEIDQPQSNHNGGQLAFGPDGFLYIGVGDGGAANDVGPGHTEGLGNGQDRSTLLGKLLRIDVDNGDNGDPYGIPADNPFVQEVGARPEIYAYGLRNPFRFSFDRGGDRRLFLGDVGQNLFEEIDVIVAAGNYGWNVMEGDHCFDPQRPGDPPDQCAATGADGEPLIAPIIEYAHNLPDGSAMGISVTGGFIYRGAAIPDLVGDYIFGDFARGFAVGDGSLFAATEDDDGQWTLRELELAGMVDGRMGAFLLSLGQDAQGELYVLTTANVGPSGTTGQVYRIVPAP